MEAATSLRARIEAAAVRIRWIPSVQQDALARTAHGSTAIEGNPLTLAETKTVIVGKSVPRAPQRSVQEIKNYVEALRHIQRQANLRQIGEKHILKVHSLLGKNNALDRGPFGYYRSYGVRVGAHIAPAAARVPDLMDELLRWLNHEGQVWPAVVSSAIAHFRFEWIHPFGDGNGRTGRILALWQLHRRDFDRHHILAVDEVLWEKRNDYYAALAQAESDSSQDLTQWIQFMASTILSALERSWRRIQSFPKVATGTPLELTPKQEKLLNLLRLQGMSIALIQKTLKVTRPGAHYLLKPLIEQKWVRREGGHKTGAYRLVDS